MVNALFVHRWGLLLCFLGPWERPAVAQGTPTPTCDLAFYLDQARQNSPLSAEVRNQGRAGQLEVERLRAFYTKATGTLVANYTGVPVFSRDNGNTGLPLRRTVPAPGLSGFTQRLGVSAGLQFSLYLFDGHQRQLSRDRTSVLLFVLPTGMRLLYHHVRPPEAAAERAPAATQS